MQCLSKKLYWAVHVQVKSSRTPLSTDVTRSWNKDSSETPPEATQDGAAIPFSILLHILNELDSLVPMQIFAKSHNSHSLSVRHRSDRNSAIEV